MDSSWRARSSSITQALFEHTSYVPLTASDLPAIIIVVVSTVFVVAAVLGLHIWGAIQDGREEKAMRSWRRRGRRN